MLTHDRINSIDIDIKLLYYLHLPKCSNKKLEHDMDAMWRYIAWRDMP